uniref:Calponin-homology (CH) domain-containing protein n=1 Tax=Plectus sambesii TaxID=2011161 RepID=A0A914VSU0_9BILA
MSLPTLDDASIDDLYAWLRAIPLSRPIKNIARDLSDGVLVAELVAHFLPRYVVLGNYTPVHSVSLKRYNWDTMNKMVFSCLDFHVNSDVIQKIIAGQAGAVEFVLLGLRQKIEQAISESRFRPRRFRSRSASRAGSALSLNGDAALELDGPMTSSVLLDNDAQFQLCANHQVKPAKTTTPQQKGFCDDLVPARQYHQARQEVLAREEQIQTMQARLRHMERLLKEERIDQLTKRLDRFAQFVCHSSQQPATATSSATASPRHVAHPLPTTSSDSVSSGATSPAALLDLSTSPLVDQSAIDLK